MMFTMIMTMIRIVMIPGPLEPPESSLPSLNITARSYSWTTWWCDDRHTFRFQIGVKVKVVYIYTYICNTIIWQYDGHHMRIQVCIIDHHSDQLVLHDTEIPLKAGSNVERRRWRVRKILEFQIKKRKKLELKWIYLEANTEGEGKCDHH